MKASAAAMSKLLRQAASRDSFVPAVRAAQSEPPQDRGDEVNHTGPRQSLRQAAAFCSPRNRHRGKQDRVIAKDRIVP